ncbi:MAG: DNA polymerase III subunit delta' [Patescibacteria group bacterium]
MIFNWPIIGHKNIVKFLQRNIVNKKIAHAYLFYGPENLGKKSVAKYFALSLICSGKEKPCLKCQNCQNFLKDIHPDVIWLKKEEGKNNISIDQIRDLKKKIFLAGFTDSYKVIIIVNAEEMTPEAANSFLKILEEPPKKSLIILLANNLRGIPKTILSRCQLLKFSLVPKKEILEYLKKEYHLSDKKAEEISAISFGRPGQAIKFVKDKKILEKYLEGQKKLIEIMTSDLNKRLMIVSEIAKENEIGKIIIGWKNLIRDIILLKTNNDELVVNLIFKEKIKKLSEKFSFEKIYQIEKELDNFNFYLNQNINLRLALDNFVINI